MFDADKVKNLFIAATQRATQKQYIAFADFEMSLTNEERTENAEQLKIMRDHCIDCMKQNSSDAIARQRKRQYQAKPIGTVKTTKFFPHPGLFKNNGAFDCSKCGKRSNPLYAPKHKTQDSGWKVWCADCGIPDEFDHILKKHPLYDVYSEWRASLVSNET
jgi:transcription elongation factor Elf1